MKKLVIIALVITSVLLLFPLRMLILSFDLRFVTEFTAGWNHRIRELIQSEQISYSQGMMLIFNTKMTISVIRRAVLGLSLWLLAIIAMIAASLNSHKRMLVNLLLILAMIVSLPLVIVPILLVIALVLFNRNKQNVSRKF